MDIMVFIFIAATVIVIPGPNVMVIVATALVHGRARGLQTVAGTSSAMILQLAIAAFGTSWLVGSLAQGFFWLKWCGVAYLLFLGINALLSSSRPATEPVTAMGSFHRGFWVSLTNPKTILFFSAFLPQFVSPASSYLPQVALLSMIFWVMAVALDSTYALLAARLVPVLKGRSAELSRRVSGVVYLGAGLLLAGVKQN